MIIIAGLKNMLVGSRIITKRITFKYEVLVYVNYNLLKQIKFYNK